MKKRISRICIKLAAVALGVFLVLGSADVTWADTMYITSGTTQTVNVRSGPGTDSDIVTTLSVGTAVETISSENNWTYISVNGVTGYVRSDLLTSEGTAADTGASDTQTGEEASSSESDENGAESAATSEDTEEDDTEEITVTQGASSDVEEDTGTDLQSQSTATVSRDTYQKMKRQYRRIIVILVIVIVLLLIILCNVLLFKGKAKDDFFDDEDKAPKKSKPDKNTGDHKSKKAAALEEDDIEIRHTPLRTAADVAKMAQTKDLSEEYEDKTMSDAPDVDIKLPDGNAVRAMLTKDGKKSRDKAKDTPREPKRTAAKLAREKSEDYLDDSEGDDDDDWLNTEVGLTKDDPEELDMIDLN